MYYRYFCYIINTLLTNCEHRIIKGLEHQKQPKNNKILFINLNTEHRTLGGSRSVPPSAIF